MAAAARMYRVFTANEQELRRHFSVYDDVLRMLELWDQQHPERFDTFLFETDRLLHNYLAAASSLADHTMRLWKKYAPSDRQLTAEHDRRVQETFRDSDVANFVQGLRNLTVHRQLPMLQGTLSFETGAEGSMTVVTALNKSALLEYDGWKSGARKYLEAIEGDAVDIEDVISDYTAAVHTFNDWFGKAFVEGHQPAFSEFEQLRAEYQALLPSWPEGEEPFPH